MDSYNEFAPFYDKFITDVDYKKRAAYFDGLIKPYIGEQPLLLDLACGTGSLSIELSRLGYEVIGVDASEMMLSIAQQKAIEAEQQILFLHQRMERLDLFGTVDACVCALDSLNHVTDKRILKRVIARVALLLSPGGVFVFDMNSVYKHRVLLADNCYVFEDDGVVCVWRNRTNDKMLTEISVDFFSRQKGDIYRRSGETFCERGYEREEIEKIISESGLKLLSVYGDDTLEPPEENTERLIFVTKKEN